MRMKLFVNRKGVERMKLTSEGFKGDGILPSRFTCDGAGVSPPLQWQDVPDGTQAFALICEDPDAPRGVFAHWVLFDLRPGERELGEGVPKDATRLHHTQAKAMAP